MEEDDGGAVEHLLEVRSRVNVAAHGLVQGAHMLPLGLTTETKHIFQPAVVMA